MKNTFEVLLPAPAEINLENGTFQLKKLTSYAVSCNWSAVTDELHRIFAFFRLNPQQLAADKAVLTVKEDSALENEAWSIKVTSDNITLAGGGKRGVLYAVAALAQILAEGFSHGTEAPVLNTGSVTDSPRFQYRSFMLDSARHFQSKNTILAILRVMNNLRLNVFHWHLTDNQGWRYQSAVAEGMPAKGRLSDGQFSAEDIKEIVETAENYGIQIVPEVDVPGHSTALLKRFPQFACDPNAPGVEICIGNPDVMPFLKKLYTELMDIFPNSPLIHLGGDEADTEHWEVCPKCQAAMKAAGCSNIRELENKFMAELVDFIKSKGRTAVLWGTSSGQVYPEGTIMQAWLNHQELPILAKARNKIIYTVNHSLYLDYPQTINEAHETWMLMLHEQDVYKTEPTVIWPNELKDYLMGTETCLWTEIVPEWRVFPKMFPRIFAYAETAWTQQEKKNWAFYLERRETLETSGYLDFLK